VKKQYPLFALVFVGGTVLMALEITGIRMLTPFFGSAIFVSGSIIGVFMVALALGYFVGGKLADHKPSEALLAGIGMTAGLLMLLVPVFGTWLCEKITAANFGPMAGPLLASFVVFTVPSVLLAMVSPFSVRLVASHVEKIGNVAGSLYSLSTTGSILGTLGTTFVLIPMVGSRMIIFVSGVVELIVALAMFIFAVGLKNKRANITMALLFLAAIFFGASRYPRGPSVEITST